VLGVEEPFSIELCDPTTGEVFEERLVGAIDAITEDENGQPHILEHKTGARKRSFEGDLQGIAYACVVAPAIGLGENLNVRYQLLLKTKVPQLVVQDTRFTSADRRDFVRTVGGVLAAVRSGAFYPRRDWQCGSCPYAGPCLAG
jgi:putative RecB family exonuclease